MNIKEELIEVYYLRFANLSDLEKLKRKLRKGVTQGKILVAYYAELLEDNKDGAPFHCIENRLDRANLTYLSYYFGKPGKGNDIVVHCDSPNEEEDDETQFFIEMGDKEKANKVYFFNLLPSFTFDSD